MAEVTSVTRMTSMMMLEMDTLARMDTSTAEDHVIRTMKTTDRQLMED
jgi:hypothetical protein